MTNELRYIILVISIFQSIFLAFHFFTINNENRKSNRILACLLLCFAIMIFLTEAVGDPRLELFKYSRIVFNLRVQFSLFIIVLLYFYVKSLLNKSFSLFNKANFLTLVPIIISFIYFYYSLQAVRNFVPWGTPMYIIVCKISLI